MLHVVCRLPGSAVAIELMEIGRVAHRCAQLLVCLQAACEDAKQGGQAQAEERTGRCGGMYARRATNRKRISEAAAESEADSDDGARAAPCARRTSAKRAHRPSAGAAATAQLSAQEDEDDEGSAATLRGTLLGSESPRGGSSGRRSPTKSTYNGVTLKCACSCLIMIQAHDWLLCGHHN